MTDGQEWLADELEREREQARRVAAVLETDGRLLEEKADRLITAGAVSLDTPAGVARAWLRLPRPGRSGYLFITTEAAPPHSLAPLHRPWYAGPRPEGMMQLGGLRRWMPALARAVESDNFRVPLGAAVTTRRTTRDRPGGSFTPIGRPVDLPALRQDIIGGLADKLANLRRE